MTQPLKFFQNFGILTMHLVLHVEFLAPSIYFSTYSYCVYYIPSIFLGAEYSEVNKTWSWVFMIAKKKKVVLISNCFAICLVVTQFALKGSWS